jgi:hypothetical protein
VTDPWGSWLVKDGPLNGYKRRALREGELWWSCLDLERVLRDFVAALERVSELERENAELLHRLHGAHAERDSAEQGDKNATAIARQWRERAERLEAAARRIVSRVQVGADLDPPMADLQAALADSPAPGREGDDLRIFCWVSGCAKRSAGDVHLVLRRARMPDLRIALAACSEHISQFERVQQDPGYVQHWEIRDIWHLRAAQAPGEKP